ncbi:MAG: hypothetical protein RLZZ453_424 [Chlamydiota bacterium]
MHIIHVAPELAPIAKVGGLADVVYGLSKELKRLGHKVSIILPKYDCLDTSYLSNLKIHTPSFTVERPNSSSTNTLWEATLEGLSLFLIESHHPAHFFQRGSIYGGTDEVDRFLYFCQAVKEILSLISPSYDALHLHDWPTAALAAAFPSLLTIHNLHYQGKNSLSTLIRAGITLPPSFIQGDLLNLLKGGIESAHLVTTVSPQYALEIQTPEGSCGLQDTLSSCREKIHGVLNGIDSQFWNPASDRYLPFHYTTQQLPAGKEQNKKALFEDLNLEYEKNSPLVTAIARLVPQKSPHLIKHGLRRTLEKGGRFILLGSSPIPEIQKEFEQLQQELNLGKKGRILMQSDEELAHRIYAASDIFLIPSLFEPCGLTQMIAMRYGTIPVARKTGGLANTVFDIDTSPLPENERNGFTFDFPDAQGLDWALLRALKCYQENKKRWQALLQTCAAYDFSWSIPTKDYLKLYSQLKILQN